MLNIHLNESGCISSQKSQIFSEIDSTYHNRTSVIHFIF